MTPFFTHAASHSRGFHSFHKYMNACSPTSGAGEPQPVGQVSAQPESREGCSLLKGLWTQEDGVAETGRGLQPEAAFRRPLPGSRLPNLAGVHAQVSSTGRLGAPCHWFTV